MDATPALLRLCECAHADAARLPLGTALLARWDPTHPRRLGVLYSSGTLELWDVIAGSRRQFALYIPAAGLPATADHARLPIPDRRAAAPITLFDFLPAVDGAESGTAATADRLPMVVFTVKRSRSLFTAELPPSPARGVAAPDHFLAGSRVDEVPGAVPPVPTTITAWSIARSPLAVTGIAVGGDDGTVAVLAASAAFNPQTVVSMRTAREAAPLLVRATMEMMPGAGDKPRTPAAGRAASAGASGAPVDTVADVPFVPAHPGHRVRALHALQCAFPWQAAGGDCHALFSAGDDGRVVCWRVAVAPPQHATAAAGVLPPPQVGGWRVTVSHWLDLPADGVATTALASVSWPLPAQVGSAARGGSDGASSGGGTHLAASAPALAALVHGAPSVAAAAAAPFRRTLLASGSVDGVVSVWEVLLPPIQPAVDAGATPHHWQHAGSGGAFPTLRPTARLVGIVSPPVASVSAGMWAAPNCASASGTSVRASISDAAVASVDPVAALALSPPYAAITAGSGGDSGGGGGGGAPEPYVLAVARVDGTLQTYHLLGTDTSAGGGHGDDSHGGSGPLTIALHGSTATPATLAVEATAAAAGRVASTSRIRRSLTIPAPGGDAVATTGGLHVSSDPEPAVLQVVRSMGPEAHLMRGVRAVGGSAAVASSAADALWSAAAAVNSAPSSSAGGGSGYMTAITMAAVADLRRAFVACGFNDAARSVVARAFAAAGTPVEGVVTASHAAAAAEAGAHVLDASSLPAVASLMACNGAGDLMLWPRGALPGDVAAPAVASVSVAAEAEAAAAPGDDADATGEQTVAAGTVGDDTTLQTAAPIGHGVFAAVDVTALSEQQQPHAKRGIDGSAGDKLVAPAAAAPADAASIYAQWRSSPVHLDGADVHGAGTAGGAAAAAYADDVAEPTPVPQAPVPIVPLSPAAIPRVLLPTAASAARAVAVAGGSASPPASGRAGRGVGRSLTPPGMRRYLQQSAAEAADKIYGPHHDHDVATSHGGVQGGCGCHATPARDRILGASGTCDQAHHIGESTPVDRWLARMQKRNAGGGVDAAPVADACHTVSSDDATDARAKQSPRATSPSPPYAAAGSATPCISPEYRNPARVAAVLARDARENMRAAILVTREGVHGMDAPAALGDEHIDAQGMYARIAQRGPEMHHHLVAPTVGSSALLAAEIARLEAAIFDPSAVAREVMARRGVRDHRVVSEVQRRIAGARTPAALSVEPAPAVDDSSSAAAPPRRGAGKAPHVAGTAAAAAGDSSLAAGSASARADGSGADDDFIYVPRAPRSHSGAAHTAGAVRSATAPASRGPTARFMRPTAAAAARAAAASDTVSASDVIKWHFGLRGAPAAPHAAVAGGPAPAVESPPPGTATSPVR